MDDAELTRRFDALMRRINDSHEVVLTALRSIGGELRNLRTEHGATREMVTALPSTMLKAIEQPLLRRITEIENRLDSLERPKDTP